METDSEDETEDNKRRILEARALAHASREARRQQLLVLDFGPLNNGSIFTTSTLLPPQLLAKLRADALALEGMGRFMPSGLTKAAISGRQQFGCADRLVCRVTPSLGGDHDARRMFKRHLDELRKAVGDALGRSLICAEQYYSIHREGAWLQRHMDEKHDELKGARGWATSHRRSVSWLLYLSAECSGGELRGYCRDVAAGSGPIGAHEGNLQVGWLADPVGAGGESAGREDAATQVDAALEPATPVYMDAWTRAANASSCNDSHGRVAGTDYAQAGAAADGWRALSALYYLGHPGVRIWLSAGFDLDAIVPSRYATSADALRHQLPLELRNRFSTVETVPHEGGPAAQVVDVSPGEGVLALFDSVSIPHEVLPTISGTRIAMAGWWHEPQRAFPDGFGMSSVPKRRTLDSLPPVL